MLYVLLRTKHFITRFKLLAQIIYDEMLMMKMNPLRVEWFTPRKAKGEKKDVYANDVVDGSSHGVPEERAEEESEQVRKRWLVVSRMAQRKFDGKHH